MHPQQVHQLGAVATAAVVGFLGNELVARHRITVGRRIGSAALVADGLHARTDGFTSLAVLVGAGGVALGWSWADPVIGLVIAVAILGVLRSAVKQVGARLMDAVDPALVDQAIAAIDRVTCLLTSVASAASPSTPAPPGSTPDRRQQPSRLSSPHPCRSRSASPPAGRSRNHGARRLDLLWRPPARSPVPPRDRPTTIRRPRSRRARVAALRTGTCTTGSAGSPRRPRPTPAPGPPGAGPAPSCRR